MFCEVWAENNTQLIKYDLFWNVWTSYTWWWIYLLIFEWIGGLMVSEEFRRPINHEEFKYGKFGFFVIHFFLIVTIFLAGFYMSKKM